MLTHAAHVGRLQSTTSPPTYAHKQTADTKRWLIELLHGSQGLC
jgi:hypothetical protein